LLTMAARARLVHERFNSTRGAGDGAAGPLAGTPRAKVRRTHTGAVRSRAKARRTRTGSAELPASSLRLGDLVDPRAWGEKCGFETPLCSSMLDCLSIFLMGSKALWTPCDGIFGGRASGSSSSSAAFGVVWLACSDTSKKKSTMRLEIS
jgi:hypothetical protein